MQFWYTKMQTEQKDWVYVKKTFYILQNKSLF